MSYRPMMPNVEIQKRVAHQNLVYEEGLKRSKPISMNFNGMKIRVSRNVFAPIHLEHNLLAKAVLQEVKPTDRVLDVGTGSGINAILAASKSGNVLAFDVNPYAVRCARSNVKINNLSSKVKVIESDLFQNVMGKFDLMIFDPPFRWTKPRNLLEKATADEDYETLIRFFSNAKRYLRKRGRIIIHFGTSADIRYFRYLVRKNGFNSIVLFKETNQRGWIYFVFRLTN